jgi:hypothetical protein
MIVGVTAEILTTTAWANLLSDDGGDGIIRKMIRISDCAIAQAINLWLFTAGTRAQSQVTSFEIRGGQSGTGAGSPPPLPDIFRYFPC